MTRAGGIILLYHRVTTLATDPQLLAVSPDHFAAQMQVLKTFTRPISLSKMVAAARRGDDLQNAVAITFDDGYADNLLEAKPILQSAGIPATVFVATGGIDSDREFFWDELDRIFLQPGILPNRLNVTIADSFYDTDLGASANYPYERWQRFRNWNITLSENPTPRHRIYRDLCGLIHKSTSKQRADAISHIQQWSRQGESARSTHRMMTRDQLGELAAGGLIKIGGHTVTHPLLAIESATDQQREIAAGKSDLESALGTNIRGFSYPFGGRRDYSIDTVAAVKSAGFEYACSNFTGVVTRETDPYQLPRILVRNWTATEFRNRLFPPLAA